MTKECLCPCGGKAVYFGEALMGSLTCNSKIDGIEVNVDILTKNCECRDCYFKSLTEIEKQNEHQLIAPVWMLMQQRMFLCEFCGNKRCPHATNHLNKCTNSNAAGQKGSAYE